MRKTDFFYHRNYSDEFLVPKNILFDTKIKFVCQLEPKILTFLIFQKFDGSHFEFREYKKLLMGAALAPG